MIFFDIFNPFNSPCTMGNPHWILALSLCHNNNWLFLWPGTNHSLFWCILFRQCRLQNCAYTGALIDSMSIHLGTNNWFLFARLNNSISPGIVHTWTGIYRLSCCTTQPQRHYNVIVTPDGAYAYCACKVSDCFVHFVPLLIFQLVKIEPPENSRRQENVFHLVSRCFDKGFHTPVPKRLAPLGLHKTQNRISIKILRSECKL